uniref:Glutathione peroxidase n=1 Tax=Chrysemys picta bellii TaxID=8478 RepID=A0A8C3HMJ0_CHRPI
MKGTGERQSTAKAVYLSYLPPKASTAGPPQAPTPRDYLAPAPAPSIGIYTLPRRGERPEAGRETAEPPQREQQRWAGRVLPQAGTGSRAAKGTCQDTGEEEKHVQEIKGMETERQTRKVSLVVNVASECGFTDSHYKALQQLQRDLGSHHFNVLAFPCNQFGQQEPDSNKEIESFARKTYGASFPMFSKIAVTGAGANAAFKYLIESTGEEPTWNFWKYLVAPNGKVVKAWDSTVTVEEIKPYITELLRKIILNQKDEL